MALQLKPKCRQIPNPKFINFFSSSSDPDSNNASNPNENNSQTETAQPKSSFASIFSDVKSSLKQQQPQNWNTFQSSSPRTRPSFSGFSSEKPPTKVASLDEIRKNLSGFRLPSATPSSPHSNTPRPISFQELYNRNVVAKPEESLSQSQSGVGGRGGDMSFATIRGSLKQLGSSNANLNRDNAVSLSSLKDKLRLRQNDSKTGPWFGGRSDSLPAAIFSKEMRQKREGDSSIPAGMKSEFVRTYNYDELGNRLRQLRPEGKVEGENWFSLAELNERLVKLREIEEKEAASTKIAGIQFADLRESLVKLKMSDEEKTKKTRIQRLDVLSHLGRTPSYMLSPPNEQLVEKYFHPDNMSSAEKLKIELQKVRDEFKMSESDCGSARVQVAQLTTKIKHLSTALHKKDKHSRKGLQEMVQKRKKLLRYLRRTDWDSYCFVLSKLGLRDNPGYKMTT